MIPTLPLDEEIEEYLITQTADIKLVSNYTGLDFNEVLLLDCYTYKLLIKDAFVSKMAETEEGREYLEQAYCLTQTAPDKAKLRKYFKRG